MDRYKALTVLAVVADAGSMRRAARILGMTPSGVSQHIAQLERDTHVALLHRSSKRLTLTEAGEALYEGGAAVLAAVRTAEMRLAELRDTPAGELSVSVPPGIAERRLAEALGPLLTEHPALSLRLIVHDEPIDLVEARIDLALCVGPLERADRLVRHLTSWETVVCAAPAYLERRGTPEVPEELQAHELLVAARFRHSLLEFVGPDQQRHVVRINPRVTTNSVRSLTQLAISGLGITMAARPAIADELADGQLVRVLPEWRLPPLDVVLLMPERTNQPAKVRCAVDALQRHFAAAAPTVVRERVRVRRG